MLKVLMVWSLAFIIKIVLSVLILHYSFQQDFDNNIMKLILVIVINLVTDIGPCFSVLEIKFIELFKQMRKEVMKLDTLDKTTGTTSKIMSLDDLDST
jgi:hypothetical protein